MGGKGRSRGSIRWGILAVALLGALTGAFLQAGNFLVVEDPFDHAEVALVLSGSPIYRALAARDLYRQGRVEKIWVIPEPPDPVDEELERLGLFDKNLPPTAERILIASGVPRSKIAFLPEEAEGTLREARMVKSYGKDKLPPRLVLITSPWASRRARFIFRQVLRREGAEILSYPTPYEPFVAHRWWGKPRHALFVAMEYQKFLVHALHLTLENFRG